MPFIVSNAVTIFCRNISHNTIYNIEIKNPKAYFSIKPTLDFRSEKITFSIDNKNFKSELENFKLNLRLLPLITGHVHINNIEASDLKFSTLLEKNFELDKDFFNKIENTKFKIDGINIQNFETQFFEKNIKTPIVYSGKDFVYKRSNRFIKLHVDSSLKVNEKKSIANLNLYLPKNNDLKKTVFEIELSNLEISPLKNYLIHYLPKDLKELNGEISVNVTNGALITHLKNIGIIMNDSSKSIIFPELLTLQSVFNISKHAILIDNLDIQSKNIHTIVKGKIYNYFGKTMPSVDLNVLVKNAKVEDVIKMLPPFQTEEFDIYSLKKYRFYGDSIANLNIKGRLPEPDINGDVYLSNGILTKPIPNTVKGATFKLKFTGKHINFDVEVPAGKTERVWVKGTEELYNIKYSDFTVKSTQNVDLHVAQSVVNPLHEILNFIVGPLPIMEINGLGNIDILVKGNRKNPHIWGVMNFKNSDAKFIEIPDFKLTNSNSSLNFNNQDMTFVSKTGKVNNKDFSINGTCNVNGKFDFNVETKNQPTEALYKAIQTATLIPDIQKTIPKLDKIKGLTDFNIKVYGSIKDIKDLKINKNLFTKGNIELKNNNFTSQNISIENTNGNISFENTNIDAQIKAFIAELPLSINAKIKNNIADLILDIPKLNPNFLITDLETRSMQYLPYISVYGKYKGNINEIEYDKLNINSKVLGSTQISKVKFLPEGEIVIANNNIIAKGIKGYISNPQNGFLANLRVTEAFSPKATTDGTLKIKTPDLTLFNEILSSDILPKNIRNYSKDFEFTKGAIDLNCKISNNKLNLYTDLSGISFIYLPYELPFEIINGNLSAKNNTLKLNKINLLADNMPVLVDGDIKDIFDKQNFNLYFNSKPQQEFIDKYINKNQIYPIKIKGDIVYWVKLKGIPSNYDLKARVDMSKNSSIYHFGATVGDIENDIVLSQESKILNNNNVKIKEFSYDKLIDSQNGKKTELNLLKAKGGVEILKDDLIFEDLIIKTNHPTDARIFNIIFRKPNIKEGQFTSDLKFNGNLTNPRIIGNFHIFETNIPFFDTSMKNIELVFKDKIIEFESKGDILGNDVIFNGILKNNLVKPYRVEKALLQTKNLNLNNIVNKIKIAEVDNNQTFEPLENFELADLITKNFKLKADNIILRNISASNFEATTSLNEKGLFSVDNFHFNIAQGSLEGKYTYNLNNDKMSINLKADEISANDITWALFDLNNQIYGDMTGTVNLTCNGADFNKCMETLAGNSIFNVKNGKMPKLGSLEYLLKASNLVKGGFTGISLNNVIDLITPLKTGEFSDIYGSVRIKDGIAQNIEITSKGKDLSLFIGGTYNFATSMAEMEVLGLLSRKISTMFGPIGNLSINSVFNAIPGVDLTKDSPILERINKIPGIELSEKAYRKFIAEIKGNINGDDYVTSFKWIN